ncbi:hypothetical protein C7A12_30075, partial [Pseudomonas fluorescens]
HERVLGAGVLVRGGAKEHLPGVEQQDAGGRGAEQCGGGWDPEVGGGARSGRGAGGASEATEWGA